ncbi:MFS transporter [Actinomadura madurae]|uniref:MFS transporter n=1 Tax=Actinomadura madurae TaxID=1993 RepID=UPI0020D20895|nr:MFS transporter [Actinomadura madurae]MCP9977986.1 MFS transporter [Actinomadura madurae]
MDTSARKWGTFAICLLVAIVPNIDLTALNQAVPHLSADLHPSSTQILWIADAYGFALAGLLITMGGVGDRIGHKRLLLLGTAVFATASALTAYAPSAELLIAARAVLGVAGATLMPSCLSLIRRAFTEPKERTMAIGAFAGVAGLAVGLGPVARRRAAGPLLVGLRLHDQRPDHGGGAPRPARRCCRSRATPCPDGSTCSACRCRWPASSAWSTRSRRRRRTARTSPGSTCRRRSARWRWPRSWSGRPGWPSR